ncbi:unnamed protein product [Ilex paraguariensis]|uniref:Uncharacterized protein n=1 Tax=Ilex paraguariensis TaxID=185542 RepID=A0ABC8U792_9AQUA
MNFGPALFIVALMVTPVTDWISPKNDPQERPRIAYVVLVLALVACGLVDGLTAGSLIGATGELPGRHMQAMLLQEKLTGARTEKEPHNNSEKPFSGEGSPS